MKLLFPTNKKQWNPNILPEIPSKFNPSSGYLMIACAYSGMDLYVCFTNQERQQVWIEKTTKLNPLANHLVHEMLVRIDSDEEFSKAHNFFIQEGFLDEIKKNTK